MIFAALFCLTVALLPTSFALPNPSRRQDNPSCTSANAGSLLCASNGMSFSICANEVWVPAGSVAAGTLCIDGMIRAAGDPASGVCGSGGATASAVSPNMPVSTAAADGSCDGSPQGTFKCSSDGQSFYQCANSVYYYMGPVAAGTKCQNGQIVAATAA